MVDPSSPVPIYHQLVTMIRREIDSGGYPLDERLPTEMELCERYGVSRTPARRALTVLAQEGLIVRYKRRGSFVAPGYRRRATAEPIVGVIPPTAEAWSALLAAVGRGEAPDAATVPSEWVPELVSLGLIGPIESEPDPLEPLWVPDAVRATYELPDATYAIPLEVRLHGIWLRKDSLGVIGGRPPLVWSDLRQLALSARDLIAGVRTPFVMTGGSAGQEATAATTWLLLASAGVGFGGAGRRTLATSGARIFVFLRRMIDTGLMSPDVVGLDVDGVVGELRSGRAVAGIGPMDMLAGEPGFLFAPFPGSDEVGSEPTTVASAVVGVVTRQSHQSRAAERRLVDRRSAAVASTAPALLAAAHAPPVTPHYRPLADAALRLMESTISGSASIETAIRDFTPIAGLLTT